MQSSANSHRQLGEGATPEPPESVDWTPDTTASQLPRAASDNHNMVEEIRVSIIKGRCLNHDHVAHVYEYKGAECSKLRQPMRAIFALSCAQLLLLVVTRSRDLSRECHVTKHKTPARSNFPLSIVQFRKFRDHSIQLIELYK